MERKRLAIDGGIPIRERYLPYGKQDLDQSDVEAVVKVLQSDYLTTGPMIETFENSIAEYVGSTYAVAFSSGTAALHAACYAAGIKENDQVITTPITFAATANAIRYQGGEVVFADINAMTYNISADSIENVITDQTKAIISVDFTGQPVDYQAIQDIATRYQIPFISDAAHSLGAIYKGKRVGSLADMTMFSFHPVKHITAGEGGVITTNNKQYYQKLCTFRNHGIVRDHEKHPTWYYEMKSLGFNYRMSDIHAALGANQAKKIDAYLNKRIAIAQEYTKAFRDFNLITTPFQLTDVESSWHLYVLRLQLDKLTVSRTEIYQALQKENIGVNVHYIPVYFHPYYQQLDYKKGICPHAESLYEEMITLPLFPKMTGQDVKDVIKAVKKVLRYYEVKA
ncbi:UDP-4-amino-4,6-dideoxy-N-acetyl-beta-L-altrosamine transaminase [Gracilibacillus kekensis]|uniref:UDP-4-amino-4,6-dideoxy-N-acetyl-beta-L-altrosamine transaminase n=1 Tax=Gracilibacillus kekensis TaxID=1027249 RepID=A0A1M7NTM7_9BACI|nr:UDP-4-amino-4,6-dideoxy-N-acetyl-beta-L-altrosamine transaminase [Gracilibacillus kekensis]SHN07326.1 UDP-4-amino-4,6-dideoxy-N-acetyl-beta-L-altrosamine transaminase [Gracilibacillus kekensis]